MRISASKTLDSALGAAPPDGRPIRVTLVRSLNGQLARIASSVRGLGLRRPHQSVVVADTAANRGMIGAAIHLLAVQRHTQRGQDASE